MAWNIRITDEAKKDYDMKSMVKMFLRIYLESFSLL